MYTHLVGRFFRLTSQLPRTGVFFCAAIFCVSQRASWFHLLLIDLVKDALGQLAVTIDTDTTLFPNLALFCLDI